MSHAPLKVIVIDDHAAWRQQIAAMIENTGTWQVVGEAPDGAEGCALAAALTPDLILLDIELPTMSGIEAATRILAHNPSAQILFLSGHSSWDVIEAAMMTGARGYLLKNFAGPELLYAMSAIAAGRRFLSTAAGGRAFGATGDHHEPHDHAVGVYASEASVLEDYGSFVIDGLGKGKTVVAVLPPERHQALERQLQARGIDIDLAIKQDRYIPLDVSAALESIVVDGLPDESRMWAIVIPLMARAARAGRTSAPALAGFGDAAQTLWNDGEPSAAILLEQFWNEISKSVNVDILCGYSLRGFEAEDEEARALLCAAHTATRTR